MNFNKPVLEDEFMSDLFSDKLNPNEKVEEEIIETSVESEKSEETPKIKSTKKAEEVVEDDLDEESDEEELEDDESTIEETEFEKAAHQLYQDGIIKELPEGVEEIKDLATYNEVIKHNQKILEKEILESVYEDLEQKLDPFVRNILSFELNSKKGGGNVVDYIKSQLYSFDITSLNEEDVVDQEEIIYQYLLSKGMEESEVNELVLTYKENPEKLKAKATEFKPKLVEIAKKEADKQVAQQKLIEDEENEKQKYLSDKLAQQLQTGKIGKIHDSIDEIPLTKEDATWLYNVALGAKVPLKIKGKTVEAEVSEALGHFHKFNKDGNINAYLTALLIQKDPNKVFDHFKKLAKKEVVKEIRTDNSFGNTGLSFNKKKEVKPKKQESSFNVSELF